MNVKLVSIVIRGAFSRRKLAVGHALIGRPVHLTTMFDEWSKRWQTTLVLQNSDITQKPPQPTGHDYVVEL